jgi:diguanylate cyclase (GGDEF)-like protein/PAS domain S-box-containing protein
VNLSPSPGGLGVWKGFRARHLNDYPDRAVRVWLVGVFLGAMALAFSGARLAVTPEVWAATAFSAAVVVVAARFPITIPGTKLVFSTTDVFLIGTLCYVGGPSAVLVAGLDAFVGILKASKRWSSRLFGPASSMIAMTVAYGVYTGLTWLALAWGVDRIATLIAAACLAALVQHLFNTMTLELLLSSKRQRAMASMAWIFESGWMAGISVVSALVAALVLAATGNVGVEAVAVAFVCVLAISMLLNLGLRRMEAEQVRQAHELSIAQEEARINQQRFSAAFTHAAGGLAIVGGDGRVIRVNRSLCQMVGLDEARIVGQDFGSLVCPPDRDELRRHVLEMAQKSDAAVSLEVRLLRSGGEVWVSLHASPFEDPGASGIGLIYQLHDISDRRAAQEQLQYAAYHDGLTGLPNRLAFLQRLQASIERSRADTAATFSALMLDLDRFKMVNDSLGHSAGNELLVEVASRLAQSVRPGDFVARLGGDEFGLMFDRIGSQKEGVLLAQRVSDTIGQPMQIGGSEFTVQCSIGLTLSDLGHRTADEMIRDADIAMYDAKGKGRGRISVFDTPMHDYVADRLYMEAELRRAIGAGQISLAYQPIVHLTDRRLIGFEALARWEHPEMGKVDVPKFITLAEESGFIAQLTPWVIEMAALQMAAWQRVLPDGERLKMHVNVSARDLELPGFTTSVATGLARARLSGHALTLEITETSLMRSMEHALPVMENLRRIGVGFSIDDFGTGYSSLSYLSALPIDSLKIDRSFVLGMDRGPQNVEIVRAILRLGQTLHMHVIAEGVETPESLEALRDIGVESGQGYLFGRPLAAPQALEQLQAARASLAA